MLRAVSSVAILIPRILAASFLMGQVMREMKGKADAASVRSLLLEKLKKSL